MHEDRDGEEVAQDEARKDAGGLAHLADLRGLADLLTVAPRAEAHDLGDDLVVTDRDVDLAVAVGSNEGLLLPGLELLLEARRERPHVGEQRAGVAAHQRTGQSDRRDAGQLDQPVGGLLLGGALVRELVPLVGDEQVEHPPAVAKNVAGEREAPGLGSRLEERLAARLGLLPAAELLEDLQSPDERRSVGASILRPFEPGRKLEKLTAAPPGPVDALVEFMAGLFESLGGAVQELSGAAAEKLGELGLQSSGAADLLESLPHAVVGIVGANKRLEDPERDRPQALTVR